MMRAWRAIALLALAMPGVASAQDQRDTEQRLQKVRSELKAVASERRQLEGARGDASRKLREADEQVGGVQRALRQTESTLQRDSASLAQMQAERTRLAGDLGAKQAELARLLRAAQLAGDDAPLKAMLAQDRLAEVERSLTYQGYLQRGRVQRIRALAAELQRIDVLEREIDARQSALARERRQQAVQEHRPACRRRELRPSQASAIFRSHSPTWSRWCSRPCSTTWPRGRPPAARKTGP